MPELRKDPVVGRWVIIATERARRPGNLVDPQSNYFLQDNHCPFCHSPDEEVYRVPDPSGQKPWRVRVVKSGTPILKHSDWSQRQGHNLYDVMNDYGTHEVVIETPEHIANMADLDIEQIKLVIDTYVSRFNILEQNPNLQYVIAYKNYGWAAGSRRVGHARSQIIATPVNPLVVKEKLVGARQYFEYHDRCLYCDLVRQEQEIKKRVVTETQFFIAITPFAPRFPFEVWIIPKKHHCDFAKGIIGQEKDLARILKEVLLRLKLGLQDPAYNYVIQSAPFRRGVASSRWKTIEDDYHWHMEVMPRLTRAAGFEKGSGFYICAIPPENTAEFLRGVTI